MVSESKRLQGLTNMVSASQHIAILGVAKVCVRVRASDSLAVAQNGAQKVDTVMLAVAKNGAQKVDTVMYCCVLHLD